MNSLFVESEALLLKFTLKIASRELLSVFQSTLKKKKECRSESILTANSYHINFLP
jgi:hypothetical protein